MARTCRRQVPRHAAAWSSAGRPLEKHRRYEARCMLAGVAVTITVARTPSLCLSLSYIISPLSPPPVLSLFPSASFLYFSLSLSTYIPTYPHRYHSSDFDTNTSASLLRSRMYRVSGYVCRSCLSTSSAALDWIIEASRSQGQGGVPESTCNHPAQSTYTSTCCHQPTQRANKW